MSRESVERVRTYLSAHAPDLDVVEYDVSTATAPLAAAAVGCQVGAIVKSLCFLIDGRPVVALIAGDMKADDRKLGALFGVAKGKVRIADATTVAHVTGYAVGGVAPVAHAQPVPVLIDDSLRRYDTVYAAGGAAHAIFGVSLARLAALSGGRFVDIARLQPQPTHNEENS